MKKLFTVMAAVLLAATAMAAELNIYASGLKAGTTYADNTVEIQYVLNTPATALAMEIYDDGGNVIATIPVTGADFLTKGAHAAIVSLADVPGGTWAWGLKATGAPNPAPDGQEDDPILEQVNPAGDVRYIFYNPQGVVVDNSFESEHFGWVYVSDAMDGDTDGMTETSKTQKRGLFIYNQLLDFVYDQHNVGLLGGVEFRDGRQGMRRLETDEEGLVYMCDNNTVDPVTTGVWCMNPADTAAPFTEVLSVAKRGTIYTKACSAVPAGAGADKVLYLLDNMERIVRYPIGQGIPFEGDPDQVVVADLSTYNLVNSESTMRSDKRGGFWIGQNRGQLDGYPMLAHVSGAGVVDWMMQLGLNDEIAPSSAYRGSCGVSADGKYVAIGGAKSVNLYEVSYKGSGEVKNITRIVDYEFPNIGTNIDGIAFDVANNIYVISASSEYLHIFSMPKDDNTFVTPAAVRYAVESKNPSALDNVNAVKAVKGVYDITGRYLGESADNLPKGMYIINGEKVVK